MKRRMHADLDMTQGSISRNLIQFALPLMATSILQLLYNAADVVVVGQFAGSQALAAVGSTGSLINLRHYVFVSSPARGSRGTQGDPCELLFGVHFILLCVWLLEP